MNCVSSWSCTMYFRLSVFISNIISHTIVMLSHCISTQSPPFILSWDELFCSLLISVRVLYQPSCLFCLHLAILFVFVVDNILLQRCKQMTIAWRRIPLIQAQSVWVVQLGNYSPCERTVGSILVINNEQFYWKCPHNYYIIYNNFCVLIFSTIFV